MGSDDDGKNLQASCSRMPCSVGSEACAESRASLTQLVAMGFDANIAQCALQKTGGKLEDALEVLTSASSSSAEMGRPPATPLSSNRHGFDDAISQLLSMGFNTATPKLLWKTLVVSWR